MLLPTPRMTRKAEEVSSYTHRPHRPSRRAEQMGRSHQRDVLGSINPPSRLRVYRMNRDAHALGIGVVHEYGLI